MLGVTATSFRFMEPLARAAVSAGVDAVLLAGEGDAGAFVAAIILAYHIYHQSGLAKKQVF
jgi:ABC-type branched-subunit amino acid transport system substrate-binding protein